MYKIECDKKVHKEYMIIPIFLDHKTLELRKFKHPHTLRLCWLRWMEGKMEWNLYYKLWVISEIVYNFHSFNHFIITKNLTNMFSKECSFHLFIIFSYHLEKFYSFIFNHYWPMISSNFSIKLVDIFSFCSPLFHSI